MFKTRERIFLDIHFPFFSSRWHYINLNKIFFSNKGSPGNVLKERLYERGLIYIYRDYWSSSVAQMVDSALPVQGSWVQSLVRELDPTCLN